MQIDWKELGTKKKSEIEGLTTKYCFYIRPEGGEFVLDVFDAKIKDRDKSYIESLQAETLIEAKDLAAQYKSR
jgi:hypothetical protein